MSGALSALAIVLLAGFPLARLLDRRSGAGEAFLIGIGASAFTLLALALAQIRWTRMSFGSAIAAVAIIAWALAIVRCAVPWSRPPQPVTLRPAADRSPLLAAALYAASVILLLGYSLLATAAGPWEFDYLGDWGLKGRVFWEARSIDWPFLERAFHRAVHADYPILLPLSFDVFAVVSDGWKDQWLGLLSVAFAAAMLLVVNRLARDELRSTLAAAFVTFAMVPFAASPWIGLGEGPLAAYATAGLLLIRRGAEDDLDSNAFRAGAVLLGLAAFTKNEGLTLIIAAALGLVVGGQWRKVVRLWPSLVIAAPWLLLRKIHSLPTDLAEGNPIVRVWEHLRHPHLIEALATNPVGKPLYWIALTVGIALTARRLIAHERFALTAIIVQFGAYVGAYLASPWDLDWHVRWSWERVVSQVAPLLTFIVMLQVLRIATSGSEAEGAEPTGREGSHPPDSSLAPR